MVNYICDLTTHMLTLGRYMPAVIAKFDSRAAKFFVSASFILATIGNQVAAGTYPFSNVRRSLSAHMSIHN
jgi:hypothetical protein